MLSSSINDTSRVIRIMSVGDTTTWSITYECNSNDFSGVIYNGNVFIHRPQVVTSLMIVIMTTLKVSFTIVIFLLYRPLVLGL